MNLYKLKINGTPFQDNTGYTDEELNGNNPYVAASGNPSLSDYETHSSILNWDNDGLKTGKDSVFVKNEIKLLFNAKTGIDEAEKWGNCTADEKAVLARCWIVSAPLVAEIYPDSNTRKYFYSKLVAASVSARQARIEKGIVYFGEELEAKEDRVDLYNTIKTSINSYVASGDSDIIDYMNSSGAYNSTTGFFSKTYYEAGLVDLFNNIVRDGLI